MLDQILADLLVGIADLARIAPGKVAAVGFCFGGGVVWQLVNAGAVAWFTARLAN